MSYKNHRHQRGTGCDVSRNAKKNYEKRGNHDFATNIWVALGYVCQKTVNWEDVTMAYTTRVEVWRWIFVKNAVKCGEKNFRRVFLTSFCAECGESRWIIYFHRVFSILTKKNRPHTGSNFWPPAWPPLLSPLRQLSLTALHFLVNLNQIE